MPYQPYKKAIDACIECATMCNHCAVSCLEEKEVQNLIHCIRLDLECAVICRAAAEMMILGSAWSNEMCQLCATICNACASECEKHKHMEHCRECAEACRACAGETMKTYQEAVNKTTKPNGAAAEKINKPLVRQEECAVISRAAAELMSLGSTWSRQISQLNATLCNAYAEQFENYLNTEMKVSRDRAMITTRAHQDLQKTDVSEAGKSASKKEEQLVQQDKDIKTRKKHSSALLAASMYRSPVSAVSSNTYFAAGGDSTSIDTEFREQSGIA